MTISSGLNLFARQPGRSEQVFSMSAPSMERHWRLTRVMSCDGMDRQSVGKDEYLMRCPDGSSYILSNLIFCTVFRAS